MGRRARLQKEKTWAEIFCLSCSFLQLLWARVVVRKWLNISATDSEFSADAEDEYSDLGSDAEETACCIRELRFNLAKQAGSAVDQSVGISDAGDPPKLKRRNSETFRAQYINTKEIRICVGTWNVGGMKPPDDIDIEGWLDSNEPADIYVLGLQEIVPLNAANIFGVEDNGPVLEWENIIRDSLNRIRPRKSKVKSYSDPPSPSMYRPAEEVPDLEEDISIQTDSEEDGDKEIHQVDGEMDEYGESGERSLINKDTMVNTGVSDSADDTRTDLPVEDFRSPQILDMLFCLRLDNTTGGSETLAAQKNEKLEKLLSGPERICLSWPEPPLNLIKSRSLEKRRSLKSSRSLQRMIPFKTAINQVSDISMLSNLNLESIRRQKRRPLYVRIVSKQMVGVFLTIWVRRSLRKHVQNLRVSTVGVGVMGYIGNKGAISVSMSIYQTFFCFVCAHLTSGEKDGDEIKRNFDVQEIHRRTRFQSDSVFLPRRIQEHDRVFWIGDLNYRISMPYERVHELIANGEFSKLLEKDQLLQELKKGHVFDGWTEGTLNFPPTYKYEIGSEKYIGEDLKGGRRNPAWCDRVLTCGKGMRQLYYRRTELKLSDHRPVTATYMVEVELFCPRKLQHALTLTDAEIEHHKSD